MSTKRILDPVHGTIELHSHELRVLDTDALQRIRRVKHLGLAYLIYPGADFSRFSHSLGVCHVTGRILETLDRIGKDSSDERYKVSEEEVRRYRMAGLLHDVGHYPFSHALEGPLRDYYAGGQLLEAIGNNQIGEAAALEGSAGRALDHEEVGVLLIEEDATLRQAIEAAGLNPVEVHSIFSKANPVNKWQNLISSDLDADRIDYLLRTAHATGLPYGSIDLDYLLTQMRLDDQGFICFTPRARRAIDHFLLSRYFDQTQVAFHKTVSGLEEVLRRAIGLLLRQGRLQLSEDHIRQRLNNGTWFEVTDELVFQMLEDVREGQGLDDADRLAAESVTRRRPPKLIFETERLHERGGDQELRELEFDKIKRLEEALTDRFGHNPRRLFIWSKSNRTLTSIGSRVSSFSKMDDLDDGIKASVRILTEGGTSDPIQTRKDSLMSILSDFALSQNRLYFISDGTDQEVVSEMRTFAGSFT